MTFSTKSSSATLADWMSSQANVTFKTFSLGGTHDGEQYAVLQTTCAQLCDGLIARRAAVCRWCKLIEACARRRCTGGCHPQLVRFVGESPGGICRNCTRRLLSADPPESPIRPPLPVPLRQTVEAHNAKPGTDDASTCAGSVASCSNACRKRSARHDARTAIR